MIKDEIRYIVMSDVHLGHRKNKTIDIIRNIGRFFNHYADRSDLDIIFIAGDLFDRLLDLPSDDSSEILAWAIQFIDYCSRNAIRLRILEGTPSHDWRQSRIFEKLISISNTDINFKYINTLSIEYMDDLGIHILYVPDEWSTTSEDTLSQVDELLKKNDLQQVDIAIMHGMFEYQMLNWK